MCHHVPNDLYYGRGAAGIGTNKCAVLGRWRFLFSTTHPASYCSMYRILSPKVKRFVNAVTLHPSGSEVKMSWATPFPSRCLGSFDKEAFIVQWNFLWQTATSKREGHRAYSRDLVISFGSTKPTAHSADGDRVPASENLYILTRPPARENFTEFCRRER
jgi:hypothetical protein